MPSKLRRTPTRRPKRQPQERTKAARSEGQRPLNFRVPAAFHQEFKMYAVSHGMSMLELLQKAFDRYKETTD